LKPRGDGTNPSGFSFVNEPEDAPFAMMAEALKHNIFRRGLFLRNPKKIMSGNQAFSAEGMRKLKA
jgi:hypothetical protein